MATFEEGLLIGLSLRRKKGRSVYRSDVFHDIIDNQEAVTFFPIDDKYKFSLGLWRTDRLDVWDSGEDNYFFSPYTDPDTGAEIWNEVLEYRENLYLILTAWEDDVPAYSKIIDGRITSQGTPAWGEIDGKKYWFTEAEYKYDENSAFINAPAWEYRAEDTINLGNGIYLNVNGAAIAFYNVKKWRIVDSGDDKGKLEPHGTDREPLGWTNFSNSPGNIFRLYPRDCGTFSDMSDSEVKEKYKNISAAICETKGLNLQEPIWVYPDE